MLVLMFATVLALTAAQPTVEDLQTDFETARPCQHEVDGREVWEGKKAFFIASYTKQAAELDPSLVGADAVLRDDNSPDVIGEFETACSD
ncbi:hypothetical protein J2Y48_004885 [Mycoplana sp. BE70]|uniref:hypothetical protein n=1 Tax=Mycoplana sp. BE70 TaxID=2817775 RepID=UPI00285BF552|nr:hypothetical protein [Mycoplana sp. BE70]MDR6759569.1 hypothetical protein [Mycoplana sp. BE70]